MPGPGFGPGRGPGGPEGLAAEGPVSARTTIITARCRLCRPGSAGGFTGPVGAACGRCCCRRLL